MDETYDDELGPELQRTTTQDAKQFIDGSSLVFYAKEAMETDTKKNWNFVKTKIK